LELVVLALVVLAVLAVFVVLFFFAGGGEGDSGICKLGPEQTLRLTNKIT